MSRKRLALLGLIVAAALSAAGVAAARGRTTSVQAASATFSATDVSQLSQVTCSVTGGDTFQATKATYRGTSLSSDPLLAGALTLRVLSVVDTSHGVGHEYGQFGSKGPANRPRGCLNESAT